MFWLDRQHYQKIDEKKYARKFTPRKPDSRWSESNKKRAEKMIQAGLMTPFGLKKIKAAKKNGLWEKTERPQLSFGMSSEFAEALEKNPKAKENFEKLAPTYQKQYLGWIGVAKQPETRKKRIRESISLLKKGEKLGLK